MRFLTDIIKLLVTPVPGERRSAMDHARALNNSTSFL